MELPFLHSSLSVGSRERNLDTNPATHSPPIICPVCKIAEAMVAKKLEFLI